MSFLIITTSTAIYFSLAMVANPFINQIAPRPMIMTCGFLTSLGLVLASVAQSWTIFAIALIFIMGEYNMLNSRQWRRLLTWGMGGDW